MYTANGEKITNEDSPLRNSDLVQLVGFTNYSNRLGDDGYAELNSRKHKLSILTSSDACNSHPIIDVRLTPEKIHTSLLPIIY